MWWISYRIAVYSYRGPLYARSPSTAVSCSFVSKRIHIFYWKTDKIAAFERLYRFAARQFTVRLGDIDLERNDEPSAPETYAVKQIHAHPKFSRVGFYNDIAVLELTRIVRKSPYVIPICLPPVHYRKERFAGARPTVVGWGTTYYGMYISVIFHLLFFIRALLFVLRNTTNTYCLIVACKYASMPLLVSYSFE